MRPMTPALLAVCLCTACCFAVTFAEDGTSRRNVLFVAEEDDDEETFNFDLKKTNFTLRPNSTDKFCFSHKVSCVRYDLRARDATTGEPAEILTFVAPVMEAERAQEERVMSTVAMLAPTYCRKRVRCVASAEFNDMDELCLVLVNADLRFEPSDPELDFTAVQQADVHVDIEIEGCRTTSQKIVAIAIPIAVFVGVAACFSTWWIRRRRKERMAGGPGADQTPNSGSNQVAMMATCSPTQQMDTGGLLATPMPMVTPANPMGPMQQGPQVAYWPQSVYGPQPGYGPQQLYAAQGTYGPQGLYSGGENPAYAPGTMNPAYVAASTRPVSSKGYPMVVANV